MALCQLFDLRIRLKMENHWIFIKKRSQTKNIYSIKKIKFAPNKMFETRSMCMCRTVLCPIELLLHVEIGTNELYGIWLFRPAHWLWSAPQLSALDHTKNRDLHWPIQLSRLDWHLPMYSDSLWICVDTVPIFEKSDESLHEKAHFEFCIRHEIHLEHHQFHPFSSRPAKKSRFWYVCHCSSHRLWANRSRWSNHFRTFRTIREKRKRMMNRVKILKWNWTFFFGGELNIHLVSFWTSRLFRVCPDDI